MKVGMKTGIRLTATLAFGLLASLAHAQTDMPNRSILKGAAVEYLFPEQVTLTAGKSSSVALHFRIAQGIHINSHTPREDFFIPTTFSISRRRGRAAGGSNLSGGH